MLIELLRRAAAELPDQLVVASPGRSLTYAECLARAEAFARGLHRRSLGRFGSVVGDVGELLALLCASSATGSEACVYPAWLDEAGIDALAAAFDHPAVVADRRLDLESAELVTPSELPGSGADPPPPAFAPVLILTTGTTGRQRGARHDWGDLIAAVRHPDARPGTRWLLAYNLNQFGGIQVLLHALVSRGTLVVPRSARPRDVVEAVRELGVTHVSATPTFWRFVTAALDEKTARELPLRQLTLGGEAVPAPLLEDLRRLFPSAHVSQIYAATEFGSAVSVRDGRSGLPVSVLDRGEDADVRLRIVDGELYARTGIGMRGYHGEPDVENEWRPTGDLVEVRGDRIEFVGRSSETINVGGTKVHPLPIERLVNAVDGVDLARAYGRANSITGEIVAVDVVARPGVDVGSLEDRIRERCEPLPPPARPRRIRFVADLDLRDHKIARLRPDGFEE